MHLGVIWLKLAYLFCGGSGFWPVQGGQLLLVFVEKIMLTNFSYSKSFWEKYVNVPIFTFIFPLRCNIQ